MRRHPVLLVPMSAPGSPPASSSAPGSGKVPGICPIVAAGYSLYTHETTLRTPTIYVNEPNEARHGGLFSLS